MSAGNNNSLTQLQQQQQSALTKGGAAIQNNFASKFTPQYYGQEQENYINQAEPQVAEQYRSTAANLNYKLGDQGLTRSSAAQQLGTSLNEQLAQNQEQVVNQAQQQVQGTQQQVAGEESQLYGQLQESQNPTAIAQSSANLAAQTAAPSVFAPIGNLFSNWSNMYLANQSASSVNQNNELALALYSPYLNNQNTGAGVIPTN